MIFTMTENDTISMLSPADKVWGGFPVELRGRGGHSTARQKTETKTELEFSIFAPSPVSANWSLSP